MAGLVFLWNASGATYMRPPVIDDDEHERRTTMDIVKMFLGASLSGLSASSVIECKPCRRNQRTSV
jgi:hypothetical protein